MKLETGLVNLLSLVTDEYAQNVKTQNHKYLDVVIMNSRT